MDKDVRFSPKKVDDSWKEQKSKEKGADKVQSKPTASEKSPKASSSQTTSKAFFNFAQSLAVQAMIHLGEMPHPETGQTEQNPDGAREIIDLLVALKEKTQDNLSAEEKHFFEQALPQIQLKYSQSV